jgi:two-component system chemotaxis response regulator CheB
MTSPRIRVLIVDDSAFARKVIREVLSRDPEIDVIGIARDGLDALEKIATLKPDVVTLDLVMPDLDGIGVLRALPLEARPSIVVVSVTGANTDLAFLALELGAVDVVTKPTPLPTDRLYELSSELVLKVKAAAIAKPRPSIASPTVSPAVPLPQLLAKASLLVIGTSTGGPQALSEILKRLPGHLPVPIAIALHIPGGYTAPLAARISNLGGVMVEEATDGMELVKGRAVIAPGGMHLRITSRGGRFFARVSFEPADTLYHPSVDLLFESAAESARDGAIGVVLTGMGNDGMLGSKAIRTVGGRVLAEAASSCVVYGMPRSVIEAGLANAQAPLEKMAELIVDSIYVGLSNMNVSL